MKFMEEKFVPLAAKIGQEKHLVAIRDAFVNIMPLTIVGAIGVLINNIYLMFGPTGISVPSIYEGYANFLSGSGVGDLCTALNRGTINMMAILVCIAVGYNMAVQLDDQQDAIACSLVCLGIYMGLTPQAATVVDEEEATGGVALDKLDSNGMFFGMILALITAEVFCRLSKNPKLRITLPDGVPPAVANSFSVLIPAIITMVVITAVGTYCVKLTNHNLWYWIETIIGTPLTNVADSVGTVALVYFMIELLWTFGLHGANIVGSITSPITTKLLADNTAAYEAGEDIPHIYSGSFGYFATIGGSGCTIGLIIAVMLFGKVEAEKTVVKISIACGIFEINEPLTFGIPIVLNVTYMIPFIVGPVVLAVVSYILCDIGIIEIPCLTVPWVTPPIIQVFLATGAGIKATIWQCIEIVALTALWTPFVMMSNHQNA